MAIRLATTSFGVATVQHRPASYYSERRFLTQTFGRGTVVAVDANGFGWTIKMHRYHDRLLHVLIGDVERQAENLPLMVVGAFVEFSLRDGFADDVVITEDTRQRKSIRRHQRRLGLPSA